MAPAPGAPAPVVLALDSATDCCSVALGLADGSLLGTVETTPRAHNRRLLPMVDGLLAESGLPRSAIDALAVTVGPGSFTGLRIGVGLAQGIAAALDLPVVPVSTLAALALRARAVHGWDDVLAILDARREERFAGRWRVGDGASPVAVEEDAVVTLDVLAGRLDAAGPGCAIAGPGGAALGAARPGHPADPGLLPDARDLVAVARAGLAAGSGVAAAALAPVYLRDASHWVRTGVAPADQATPCPPGGAC